MKKKAGLIISGLSLIGIGIAIYFVFKEDKNKKVAISTEEKEVPTETTEQSETEKKDIVSDDDIKQVEIIEIEEPVEKTPFFKKLSIYKRFKNLK